MSPSLAQVKPSAVALLLGIALCSARVDARRYPITRSDASGTWVGTRSGLLHGAGELWQRYGPGDGLPSRIISDVELAPRDVWVATPRGLARLHKGSRRWEVHGPPDLPSAVVTGVSVDPSDPEQVWVATHGGLASYNTRTNRWQRITGLPSDRVNDVLFRGRTVWAATDAGLVAHDVRLRTSRVFTTADGLPGNRVLELEEQAADLWLTTDRGLARISLQRRTLVPFGVEQGLPGTEVRSWARLQTLIYIVTDGGLITYDVSADSLAPFVHAKGLLGARVRAVAAAGGFAWFATDRGLCRFDPIRKTWEYYRTEDGVSSDDLQQLTVSGNLLLIFGAQDLLDTYDYKRDEWVERSPLLQGRPDDGAEDDDGQQPGSQPASGPASRAASPGQDPATEPERLRLSVSAELDTELKQDLILPRDGPTTREGYWLVNTLRLGAGAQWASGRKLDVAGEVDYGDISPLLSGDGSTLASFQRYELELRYLGLSRDLLQEGIVSHQLRLEPSGGRLTERTEVEGARLVLAAGPRVGSTRFATLRAVAGLRRGTPLRVVFRRPEIDALKLKRFELPRSPTGLPRYVIPSSVRATLDGRELERNVDYFVDHENGVLWLRNTDLVHAMRVLEVEYEYEQIPRKELGVVSMTNLLPKDGAVGQLKRAGRARWARDEQGLFDEINGGAEQYINRGWDKTLSQDFEWGSAGVTLRIHDMADEKNALAISLARRLPDAKPVTGLPCDVYIEKQPASISIKLVSGRFFVEVSIDQGSMEQEIVALAGWLCTKLASSGSTSADALRDAMVAAMADFQFGPRTRVGVSYLGSQSLTNEELPDAPRVQRNLLSAHAAHSRKLGRASRLTAEFQAAASASEDDDRYSSGAGVLGRLLLTSPRLELRAAGRRYSDNYGGIGAARQTEFCRTADRRCLTPGTSRMAWEAETDATVRAVQWLPLQLAYQHQSAELGSDYADAPASRQRLGLRDIADARLSLDHARLPKLSAGGAFIRRDDALSEQGQWRAFGSLESDLGATLLRGLRWKKIYLRGLYDLGLNAVDEFRADPALERDRDELMHHAVAELRLAPSLTENAFATLEYHRLRGVADLSDRIIDRLAYWRLETGAGSSIVPGIALRFDGTFWFGDDQPLVELSSSTEAVERQRSQEADSRLAGVADLFFGEWVRALGPLKLNGAYTYTRNATSGRALTATGPPGTEICELPGDEDGDGLADCADPDCALADVCLLRSGKLTSHRVFGTLSWDTPGKLQVELFGDVRLSYSDRPRAPDPAQPDADPLLDTVLRARRYELRSFVTYRPIQPSPVTLRFDVLHDVARPDRYDELPDPVEQRVTSYEPALEWRRRWSAAWWHLAKLTLSHARTRDFARVRTVEDAFGRKGDLERLDFDVWAISPSVEIRRRFEAEGGSWNLRPYLRTSYKLQVGQGVASRVDGQTCSAGDDCLSDGSETNQVVSLSLGLLWVHAENLFVDLDLTGSFTDCRRAPTGSTCNDRFALSPHLLATARF